jgi:repressor LexA
MLGRNRSETYVLQVKGDSMIDEQIRDGDYVIVENRKSARDGEMVIALIDGDKATLKKFFRERGGKVRLQPANARMKPIIVDAEDLQVQGVVIGVLRKY